MNNLDIGRLRSLIAVAEGNSVSEAANRVGRTQSAVSMQMRDLEQKVGGPLFRRTRHGVVFTKKGEQLLAHARAILKLHDQALAELSGETVVGEIRLGCPEDYAQSLSAPLSDFTAEHPLTQLEFVCAPTPELQQKLQDGALDLAIVTIKRARKKELLRREQLVWAARADLAKLDLATVPLALSHAESIDRIAALEALRRARRDYRIVCASGSVVGLKTVLDAGIAIAVFAQSILPKGLTILNEGLPRLPKVEVALLQASDRPSEAVAKLAARLKMALALPG